MHTHVCDRNSNNSNQYNICCFTRKTAGALLGGSMRSSVTSALIMSAATTSLYASDAALICR